MWASLILCNQKFLKWEIMTTRGEYGFFSVLSVMGKKLKMISIEMSNNNSLISPPPQIISQNKMYLINSYLKYIN